MGFSMPNLHFHNIALRPTTMETNSFPRTVHTLLTTSRWSQLRQMQNARWNTNWSQVERYISPNFKFGMNKLASSVSFRPLFFFWGIVETEEKKSRRGSTSSWRVNALPDWPLMAVMIEHVAGQRDFVVHKSVWHLSDEAMKNVYTMYIMFTCWGCCFFGATKDPFYDGEDYRKDGGDGTVHWYYEKQEDIEAAARAELWREELIEEIEQKVGGLRELEEAGKEEELVK